jgi:RimJ/RimL family protein N-acetyltransferase
VTLLEQASTGAVSTARRFVLKTRRLMLGTAVPDDAKAITALINDHRVAGNMASVPHPYTLTDAEAAIEAANGKPLFVISLTDGRVIGGGGLAVHAGYPELAYWLGVPYWGNGYATEAARALVDFAFADLECAELHAGARVTNPASRRVLEKCGFEWTGIKLQRIHALNASVPSDRFRLDRARWASLRNSGKVQHIA